MPRKMEFYAPDQMDCNSMVTCIGGDFGLSVTLTTSYERDQVVTIARCYAPASAQPDVVQVQALVRAPLRTAKSLYTMQYSALLDCWHQLDRGVLSTGRQQITYSWSGRPEMPERRT